MKTNHALKIEDLDLPLTKADSIAETLKEFLSDVGFSDERIEPLECRRRDGFIPFSHNLGGYGAVMFTDQEHIRGMGMILFPNSDATLEKYYQYDVEYFESKDGFNIPSAQWTEEQWNEFDESRRSDDQATVLFATDVMYQGCERGIHSVNIRITVCVKDAPYHRQYDDLFTFDVNFRTVAGLKSQLAKILKNKDVKHFGKLLNEGF